MGNCVSNCFGAEQKTPGDDRKVSHVYLSPFKDCPIVTSDKHDDKFYYIKNEEEIDKIIDRLDDTVLMNDAKAALLTQTIAKLREQKNKLTIFPSYDSADDTTAVREVDEEQEEASPLKSIKTFPLKAESPLKQRRSQTMINFSEISLGKPKKELTQGNLIVELQRGHFVQNEFLKKYNLCKPYVVLKLYRNEMLKSRDLKKNCKWTDIAKFQSQSSQDFLKPSWDEIFEFNINDGKKVSAYSVGISLFYMFNKDHTSLHIGDEQMFSIGSLMDQSMQLKQIDFKDPEYKGLLARVKVRFQFIYDLELLKERLLKDIKAKMERLSRIRERHPMFENEKKDRGSILLSLKRTNSKRGSEWSRSSTHEQEERGYYVAEKFDI